MTNATHLGPASCRGTIHRALPCSGAALSRAQARECCAQSRQGAHLPRASQPCRDHALPRRAAAFVVSVVEPCPARRLSPALSAHPTAPQGTPISSPRKSRDLFLPSLFPYFIASSTETLAACYVPGGSSHVGERKEWPWHGSLWHSQSWLCSSALNLARGAHLNAGSANSRQGDSQASELRRQSLRPNQYRSTASATALRRALRGTAFRLCSTDLNHRNGAQHNGGPPDSK